MESSPYEEAQFDAMAELHGLLNDLVNQKFNPNWLSDLAAVADFSRHEVSTKLGIPKEWVVIKSAERLNGKIWVEIDIQPIIEDDAFDGLTTERKD